MVEILQGALREHGGVGAVLHSQTVGSVFGGAHCKEFYLRSIAVSYCFLLDMARITKSVAIMRTMEIGSAICHFTTTAAMM